MWLGNHHSLSMCASIPRVTDRKACNRLQDAAMAASKGGWMRDQSQAMERLLTVERLSRGGTRPLAAEIQDIGANTMRCWG